MIEHKTSADPYQPPSSESERSTRNIKALKYIFHSIYLQLFLGAGMLMISAIGINTGPFFDGPRACGVLLIALGFNSWIYASRYKRSLQ